MPDISYIVSPAAKLEIERAEKLRNSLLLLLIDRPTELEARFGANLERTTYASRLTARKLKKSQVLDLVNPFEPPGQKDLEIQGYFKAYLWIDKKWFLNRAEVESQDVKKILSAVGYSKHVDMEALAQALAFIQVKPEHPLVQSALFFASVYKILSEEERIKLSTLLSNIFMYKAGFDFRGMLCLEEFFANDIENLKKMLSENLSGFIEYFAQSVSIQAERTLLKMKSYQAEKKDLFSLSDREQEILALFDKPGVKITNRRVQKEFGVSQITASRDLSRLASLSLIFKNGQGRSIYYTKF